MQFKEFLVLSLFCLTTVLIHQSNAACGSCQPNGIACMNTTTFNLCYDNNPSTTETFTCPPGEICTSRAARCFPEGGETKPSCEISQNCGFCDGLKMFVCVSRNKFVQCEGSRRINNTYTCPDGMFCRSSGGEICVSECLISRDGYECDSVEEVFN